MFVGHDWGSPVVWSLASHHPDRCHGVANLCVPYIPDGFAPFNTLSYQNFYGTTKPAYKGSNSYPSRPRRFCTLSRPAAASSSSA